jgi:hypothetical protein
MELHELAGLERNRGVRFAGVVVELNFIHAGREILHNCPNLTALKASLG